MGPLSTHFVFIQLYIGIFGRILKQHTKRRNAINMDSRNIYPHVA